METEKKLKVCEFGHRFYKSSDCLTCPTCERLGKPTTGFLSRLTSPARNALVAEDITTLEKLSRYTEKEILKLHGMGPGSLPILRKALEEEGLSFKT